jgi:SAM-dependent methyltransferase
MKSISYEIKKKKLDRIRHILRDDMPYTESDKHYNFLSQQLREQYNIVDTANVSGFNYDHQGQAIIDEYKDGLILDCGAGKREIYFENVVNYEIVPYESTDVLGVGEKLPFKDESFDAVLSVAVLEHVKDPFLCAREIVRVMKPGAKLFCCVPLLQPLHAFPHHYYNMTHFGLRNLFDDYLTIEKQEVYFSLLPIFSLNWILNSWVSGLPRKDRKEFLNMKVSDLCKPATDFLDKGFVKNLPEDKNFELASGTVLHAKKK